MNVREGFANKGLMGVGMGNRPDHAGLKALALSAAVPAFMFAGFTGGLFHPLLLGLGAISAVIALRLADSSQDAYEERTGTSATGHLAASKDYIEYQASRAHVSPRLAVAVIWSLWALPTAFVLVLTLGAATDFLSTGDG